MRDLNTISISLKSIKRYPDSKRTKSWVGKMVHIEHGVWREGGVGFTWAPSPRFSAQTGKV
jgi:hypothetical protein